MGVLRCGAVWWVATACWLVLAQRAAASCRKEVGPQRGACEALCNASGKCELRAALLLPASMDTEANLPMVMPATDLAVEEARARGLLPDWLEWSTLALDDQCDAAYAVISAIDAYSVHCAHVFFGPACDFALASVARIAKFLGTGGVPLVTGGGLSFDFVETKRSCDDEYYMLARTGLANFRDIALFIIAVMKDFNWRKLLLINEPLAQYAAAGKHTCHLMMKTMAEYIKQERTFKYAAWDTTQNSKQNYSDNLRFDMGMKYTNIVGINSISSTNRSQDTTGAVPIWDSYWRRT